MKRIFFFLLFLAVQIVLFGQEYYPEGTKWTEIRLDTLKYDSWYSKIGDEWVPNFETIEYYVKGEYVEQNVDNPFTYKKVYSNGPEWKDSLSFLIMEKNNSVWGSVFLYFDKDDFRPLWPGEAYQFDWSLGKCLFFREILECNTTSIIQCYGYYGIIDEIKEGDFGGVRPLKYVDLDGRAPENDPNIPRKNFGTRGGRIIQGIGITEWNDGECLFGPLDPYFASGWDFHERHYRSMLVHFERNGEVLYDVWPEKGTTDGIKSISNAKAPNVNTRFDLQGRRLSGKPSKGVYIENGRKRVR